MRRDRPLEEGDPVVLPSGRRAIVTALLVDGRVELRYLGSDTHDLVSLPESFVRRIEPGVLPPPVRIASASK